MILNSISRKNRRMNISTEEFISLIEKRPQLWQKWHPEFQNRDLRNKELNQLALASGLSVQDSAKKLKMLKDTMRARIATLPKTSDGLPDFSASSSISWPYFQRMMFMKEEFTRPPAPSASFFEEQYFTFNKPDGEEPKEEYIEPPLIEEDSDLNDSSMTALTFSSPVLQAASAEVFPTLQESSPFHAHPTRSSNSEGNDCEDRTEAILERLTQTDEFDIFAKDIANDLRKLKHPANLIMAKAAIRRVVESSLLQELRGENKALASSPSITTYQSVSKNVFRDTKSHLTLPTRGPLL